MMTMIMRTGGRLEPAEYVRYVGTDTDRRHAGGDMVCEYRTASGEIVQTAEPSCDGRDGVVPLEVE